MSVTPKVYQFRPGAKNGPAIIDGVSRVMADPGTHHWEVVPGSYVAGSTIALRDKATSGTRILTLTAETTPLVSVRATYSHDEGVNTSPVVYMHGNTATYQLNSAAYGMGIERAFVVEVEDAISILTEKGSAGDGGSSLLNNAFSMSIHAGRILSAHNRSDSANRRHEEGVMGGVFGASSTSAFLMINNAIAAAGSEISRFWNGVAYRSLRLGATGTTGIDFLDQRVAAAQPIVENVGDAQEIERLVPYSYTGAAGTGIHAGGNVGSSRYFRARKYGYGDVPPGPGSTPIDNLSVFPSLGSPDIGWRHSSVATAATFMINTIHIWCPPGAEVIVP